MYTGDGGKSRCVRAHFYEYSAKYFIEIIWENWAYIVEMGNLEGIDSMNCTTIVEGNVREMVVMGDDRYFE